MSLAGKTVWVVGGVGVVGRGIARGLLQAGATVIVNSRSEERLERIVNDLQTPERLISIVGSLRPGLAKETVEKTLSKVAEQHGNKDKNGVVLDHVVAHGAVRYWSDRFAGCDETYSLKPQSEFLQQTPEEFVQSSSMLASYHYSAAQQLLPHVQNAAVSSGGNSGTYTFVTGDGGGHPSTVRTALGELNSHHVWGLAAAMRRSLKEAESNTNSTNNDVILREIRVGLEINRPQEDRRTEPRLRPVSEDIGDLCAGLIVANRTDDRTDVIRMETQEELEDLLVKYHADQDKDIGPLPSISEFAGSL